MDPASIRTLLDSVADGTLSPEDALNNLRDLPFENLGFAHVDHHRTLRTGHPEVIFCQGKTPEQIIAIASRLLERESQVLGTRIAPESAAALCERYPKTQHDELARTVFIPGEHTLGEHGRVLVVSAGTSDLPVAREAEITARAMGSNVESIVDVGVAGIHRLLAYRDTLRTAKAIVVVAGMEGALASVVGGLVDTPVIAVPTSVGYGTSFNGLSALLTMLNSCASGVSVVNIDNGFGAGYSAALINNQSQSD